MGSKGVKEPPSFRTKKKKNAQNFYDLYCGTCPPALVLSLFLESGPSLSSREVQLCWPRTPAKFKVAVVVVLWVALLVARTPMSLLHG